jgi:hypothetical protein
MPSRSIRPAPSRIFLPQQQDIPMARPKKAATATAVPKRRTKISAKLAATEDKSNRHWRAEFLDALAETSNVSAACAAAGVHPSRPYKVRRLEPDFAREWRAALCEGYENLELEMLHRLRFGDPKDSEVKFDNAVALRLLGLHRDTVARERAIHQPDDVALVRATIQAKLDRLRDEVMARRAAMATIGAPNEQPPEPLVETLPERPIGAPVDESRPRA